MIKSQTVKFQNRREFLKQSLGASSFIAPGVMLVNKAQAYNEQAVNSEVNWGMLVDLNKCKDNCDQCVSACQTENGWGTGSNDEQHSNDLQKAQWIRTVTVRNKVTDRKISLPLMCQHCENPPCVDVCPTNASFKRPDGVVLVDKHRCIGCRYCIMACPYKARSFVHEPLSNQKAHAPRGKGTVESCTFCTHRIDQGQIPACVESCPNDAMIFGDLNDKDSDISKTLKTYSTSKIRDDLGLNPSVSYRGL